MIITDFTLNYIILIWYLAYIFNIFTYFNPLFPLLIGLIENIIRLFIIKPDRSEIIKILILSIIIKIIPIILLINSKIEIRDILFTFFLTIAYLLYKKKDIELYIKGDESLYGNIDDKSYEYQLYNKIEPIIYKKMI